MTTPKPCPTCKGSGVCEWFTGPTRHVEECADCDGNGEVENLDGEMDKETGNTNED